MLRQIDAETLSCAGQTEYGSKNGEYDAEDEDSSTGAEKQDPRLEGLSHSSIVSATARRLHRPGCCCPREFPERLATQRLEDSDLVQQVQRLPVRR